MCFVLLPYRLIVMKTKMTLSHLHIHMQRADCVYFSWCYQIIRIVIIITIIIKQPDFPQFFLERNYLERSFMPLFKACLCLCFLCSFFAELCCKVFFLLLFPGTLEGSSQRQPTNACASSSSSSSWGFIILLKGLCWIVGNTFFCSLWCSYLYYIHHGISLHKHCWCSCHVSKKKKMDVRKYRS